MAAAVSHRADDCSCWLMAHVWHLQSNIQVGKAIGNVFALFMKSIWRGSHRRFIWRGWKFCNQCELFAFFSIAISTALPAWACWKAGQRLSEKEEGSSRFKGIILSHKRPHYTLHWGAAKWPQWNPHHPWRHWQECHLLPSLLSACPAPASFAWQHSHQFVCVQACVSVCALKSAGKQSLLAL